MAIVDGRTLIRGFNSTAASDLAGANVATSDTSTKIEGTQSYSYYSTNTRDGLLANNGSTLDLTNAHVYIWLNCGVVGILDTFALGGCRARFCGVTAGNYFEVNIGGSDFWPQSISGGWTQFVVDVSAAAAAPDASASPPATSAIQFVGITTITDGTMPRMADNTWIDAIWYLPSATAGIRVEGQNGANPYTWADLISASDTGGWGTAKLGAGGSVIINTPIQFGLSDTATHEFEDTNKTVLWEDQPVGAPFYGMYALGGGSGTTSVIFGDPASASQGGSISAAPSGRRFYMDFNNANVDTVGFYGTAFQHGATFNLDSATVTTDSCLYIDTTSLIVSGSSFDNNSVIDPNIATSSAAITTTNLNDITNASFTGSANGGYAIEVTTLGTGAMSWDSTFSSSTYAVADGATGDEVIYVSAGAGALDINVTAGSTPTVDEGTSTVSVNVAGSTTLLEVSAILVSVADEALSVVLEEDVISVKVSDSPYTVVLEDY